MKLHLYEEVLLLALDDEKGIANLGGWHTSAMGGAIFAELTLMGRLAVADDKKRTVTLRNPAPTGDHILDEGLAKVRDDRKARGAQHWASTFANLKDLQKRAARQLVDRGILSEGEDKVLLIFKRTIFPEVDGGPEKELRERLRRAIFTDSEDVGAETIIIVALTDAADMLTSLFDKKELKARKARIKGLVSGELAGQATREAVEAIRTALLVTTVIVPVVISSTTT